MSRSLVLAAAAVLCMAPLHAQAAPPAHIAAAVADPGRPAADVERDADRKPAEMLEFAQVRPGQVVGDLLPGRGYFTRIFAKAVGPQGKVLAIAPPPAPPAAGEAPKPNAIAALAAEPAYGNVTPVTAPLSAIALPEQADVIWTSQNYHDFHLTRFGLDVPAVNKAIFAALKPGGLYVVLDHAAAPGAPVDVANTLHRIDPAIVRREVEAAGFIFDGESTALRNPADNRTVRVDDPAIRGHTDQFIYRFRKPK